MDQTELVHDEFLTGRGGCNKQDFRLPERDSGSPEDGVPSPGARERSKAPWPPRVGRFLAGAEDAQAEEQSAERPQKDGRPSASQVEPKPGRMVVATEESPAGPEDAPALAAEHR